MEQMILVVHTHAIGADGRAVHFTPGDPVPAWAEAQLTNPKLWGGSSASPPAPAAALLPGPQDPAGAGEGSGTAKAPAAPPRSGPGSGTAAWAEFAAAAGVETGEKASREDLIAACEAAGIIEAE